MVAISSGALVLGAVLLCANLQGGAVLEAPPEVSTVTVRRQITRRAAHARVWRRLVHTPAADMHAELFSCPLDDQILQRPQWDRGEVVHRTHAGVERIELDAVVKHADPPKITLV